MVEYFAEMLASYRDFRGSPQLLIPFLLQGVVIVIILAVAFGIGFSTYEGGATLKTVDPVEILSLVLAIGLPTILVLLMVSSWFGAGILGMANAVVEGRHASVLSFFASANGLFLILLGYTILELLLSLFVSLPELVYNVMLPPEPTVGLILLGWLFSMFTFVLSFLLAFALFFAQAAIIRKQLGPIGAIADSFRMFRYRPGHVFASWGMTFLVGILIFIVLTIIMVPLGIFFYFMSVFPLYLLLGGIFLVVLFIVVQIVFLCFTLRMFKVVEGTATKNPPPTP